MFKKILHLFVVVLIIGVGSVYFRGYSYQESKLVDTKAKVFEQSKPNQETKEKEKISNNLEEKITSEKSSPNNVVSQKSEQPKKKVIDIQKNNNDKANSKKENTINVEIKIDSSNSSINNSDSDEKKSKVEESITTSSENLESQEEKYIGIPDPNHFNYSIHHGVIDYYSNNYPGEDIVKVCYQKSIDIAFKDPVDILSTACYDVKDSKGNILGAYLQINCTSGNCNKYKN